MGKIISSVILAVFLVIGGFVYYKFYFVFAEGVKSGTMNQIVKKGYIWKTYEGRLIQNGLKAQNQTIQSFTFEFSVEDTAVARKLEMVNGGVVTLHYLEYKSALPWRGNTNYVVDSIVVSPSYNHVDPFSPTNNSSSNAEVKKKDNLGDYPTEWYE